MITQFNYLQPNRAAHTVLLYGATSTISALRAEHFRFRGRLSRRRHRLRRVGNLRGVLVRFSRFEAGNVRNGAAFICTGSAALSGRFEILVIIDLNDRVVSANGLHRNR